MRTRRIKAEGGGYYHCMSRIVDGRYIFGTSGKEAKRAERFVRLMRRLEAFTGVEVLTYALMSNHFHALCEEPERRELTDEELLDRIEAYYGYGKRKAVAKKLSSYGPAAKEELRNSYLKRMFDVSIFMKELKGLFAQWFNREEDRHGVLWSERFKSVLVEGGEALMAVAAYIDLNPVRAGLCLDPKDYRFCGYAELVGTQSKRAYRGIGKVMGVGENEAPEEIERNYRKLLFVEGGQPSRDREAVYDNLTVEKVVVSQDGEIPLPTRLRSRIRYFTEGAILGSQLFVEKQVERIKGKTGQARSRLGAGISSVEISSLWAMRGSRLRSTG